MSDGREASERIVDYYSLLFTFPSRRSMIAVIITISTLGGVLSFDIGSMSTGIVHGLQYGLLGLAFPLLLSDFLIQPMFRGDVLLNPRRFTILTYVSSIVYTVIIIISSVMSAVTVRSDIILRGIMMAVAINTSLRYLSINVLTIDDPLRNLTSIFLQPSLCFAAATILFPFQGTRILGLGVLAVAILVGGVELLLRVLGRWRSKHPGLKLIPLLRAFVLAWAEEVNEPLEEQITSLGEIRDLMVDSIVFDDVTGDCIAALIVPYIHPGPFKNVGSSDLPSVLVDRIGQRLSCETLVAHGISTHERDMTRSRDSERVADSILSYLRCSSDSPLASSLIWSEGDGAQASCQLFGDVAIITLSLSPKNYDDLPEELADRIMDAAMGLGLTAVVVDSHHSLLLDRELDEYDVDSLYDAATAAMSRAKMITKSDFAVGVARVLPREWGLEDGMGPCGIAAIAVRLENGQTSAYVVIDGNNMMSGLREAIVGAVRGRGIDEVEVMTSDTHLVNAIGATSSGYFPIGENMDKQKVIDYTVETVEKAVSRLRTSRAHHVRTKIPGVSVLGSKGLRALRQVLESGFSLFKTAGLIIAPIVFFFAAIIVYLL